MKKNLISITAILLSTLVYLGSCSKENNGLQLENQFSKQVSQKSNMYDLTFLDLPKDSKIEELDNVLFFEVPQNYLIIGIDEKGIFYEGTKGSITCNCISNANGCSPGLVGNTPACVMTDCENCIKKSNISNYQSNILVDEIVLFNNTPIAFLDNVMDLNGKAFLPAAFYEHPMVINVLQELQDNLIKSSQSEKTKINFISIFGYIVPIEVPEDIDNTSPFSIFDSNKGITCACNDGGKSSCPKKSKLIATWCDASACKSCTMGGFIYNPFDVNTYALSVVNNRIEITLQKDQK